VRSIYSEILFKVSVVNSGFEGTEENVKCRAFNSEIVDKGSLKLT
jgi:hypothetical protein